MKRLAGMALIAFALTLCVGGCQKRPSESAKSPFHIGIVTGTTTQSEDEYRGALQLIKEFGAVGDGGTIRHVVYPDYFPSQRETVISTITALADDPLIRIIVVNQAVPGTAEAFRRIRTKNADILLLSANPQEDLPIIQAASDMVVDMDFVSRGYTIVWAAKQLGAKAFVHISFGRHIAIEKISRRLAVFEAACKDLGLQFAFETAPDPTTDVGMAGAQQFIGGKVALWLKKYGPSGEKVAMFCTNDGETEPLIRELLKSKNGIFVESDMPSPLMGYPKALGIDLSKEAGDMPAILRKVEDAVVAKGGAGRFGTWKFSYNLSLTVGLAKFGIEVVKGRAAKDSIADLFKSLQAATPGVMWNGSYYTDALTGIHAKNEVLVFMDTYILGRPGYMLPTTRQKIDPKYGLLTKQ